MKKKYPASVNQQVVDCDRAIARCNRAIAAEKKRLRKGLPQVNPLAPSLKALELSKRYYQWLKRSAQSSGDKPLGRAA